MGLIGTLIHVISYDIKFIFLGYWSPLLVKFIGLGELLSNYFMTMSIDDHMIWRRSISIENKNIFEGIPIQDSKRNLIK
jgi:hypothetical protein